MTRKGRLSTPTSGLTDVVSQQWGTLANDSDDPLAIQSKGSYYARDDLDLGFMGFTSHSADLAEHRVRIEGTAAVPGTSDSARAHYLEVTQTSSSPSPSSSALLRVQRLCLAILECLPTREAAFSLLDSHRHSGSYFGDEFPTLIPFYERFWEAHGQALKRPRDRSQLLGLSDVLCRNTSKNLEVPSTNQQWLDSICNFNSRWELVGVVMVIIASCAWNRPDNDPILQALCEGIASNKRDYACRLLEASDACHRLCTNELKQNNRLTVLLFGQSTWLQSIGTSILFYFKFCCT